MAERLAARPGVRAVLFYGNRLRDPAASGLLDFYVLIDSVGTYHGRGLSALANRLLPPNVYHEALADDGTAAKVAVMRLDAFASRMRRTSWDTTLWARFCQPSILIYAAGKTAREDVIGAVVTAHQTAAWWAARLAPAGADAETAWRTLFAHTYGAELRVEGQGRAVEIFRGAADIYTDLYAAQIGEGPPDDAERRVARRSWALRRLVGKPLNLARLIKAAFTFRGGIAYALSKVERHSGRPIELGPVARRLPWLAAPFVMIRLLLDRRLR